MLNEIREFEEYVYDLKNMADEERPRRIKYTTLAGVSGKNSEANICGIERFLTVISRELIFGRQMEYPEAGAALWCGSDAVAQNEDFAGAVRSLDESIGYIRNWFPSYIKEVLLMDKVTETENALAQTFEGGRVKDTDGALKDCSVFKELLLSKDADAKEIAAHAAALQKKCDVYKLHNNPAGALTKLAGCLMSLSEKADRFDRPSISFGFRNDSADRRNDYKNITYDKIVSMAYGAGPLKRYYLVCRKDRFEIPDRVTKKRTGLILKDIKKDGNSMIKDTDQDIILKVIASYLITERRLGCMENSRYLPVNYVNISNWLKGRTRGLGSECRKYSYFDGEDNRNLFATAVVGDCQGKLKVDDAWLKEGEWQIIDATDSDGGLDDFLAGHGSDNYIFFRDDGANQFLVPGARYSR